MRCKYTDLPSECQECMQLQCGNARMEDAISYYCRKIAMFDKNKEKNCPVRTPYPTKQ